MVEEDSGQKRKFDELRLLYTVSASDIAFFKQQQWRVTNYGLVLYAAAVSIPKFAGQSQRIEFFILFFGALSILISGWHIIGLLDDSILHGRRRLIEVRTHFTDDFKSCSRGGRPETERPDRLEEKGSLLWFFRTVFLVGFVVVSWLLFKFACIV